MKMTDAEIQQSVLNELKWDTRVRETEVGVEVHGGVVTLSGIVHSWAKRIAAQEAAHRVRGVLDVANEIEVRSVGSPLTDTEVAGAVRHALEWDVFVPEKRIRSTVSNGWVMLEGDVDCWSERQDAESAVRDLAGVNGITNKIEIKPKVFSGDVHKSVEEALERRAQREAGRIKVDVHDGRVVLSGVVHSLSEREAVLGAARGTYGVRGIEDRLRVEPG